MTTHLKDAGAQGSELRWFQIGRFLLLALLAAAIFVLAQSMVRHRFFRGGRIDKYGDLRQN